MGTPRPEWRAAATALAVLVAIPTVLFRQVLFSGRVFYERDVHSYFLPLAEILKRMVGEGTWPLWNPYMAFGQPLLADPPFEVFYPFAWLLMVTSPPTYYTVFVVAHAVFSAVGVYLLCRTLGLGRVAAITGGGVWVASGPLMSLVNLWHHLAGAAWIPWVLLGAVRFARRPSAGRAAAWGVAAGLQLLTGSADMSLLAGVAAALWVALSLVGATGSRARILGLTAMAGAVAIGLAAAQWVPTMALAWSSARGLLTEADRTFWSVHPLVMLQTVLPVPLRELPIGPLAEQRLFESREPFLFSLYLGLPAAALVAAAAADRGAPWRRYALALGALTVLGAMGRFTPVYHLVTLLLPVFRLVRYPTKAMALVALLWAVLAAVGLEACRRRASAARVAIVVAMVGAVLAAGLAILCAAGPAWLEGWIDAAGAGSMAAALQPAVRRLWSSAALALLLAGLTALHRRGWRGPYAPLAAACVIADLMGFHAALNDTAPPEVYSYQPLALRLLPGHQWSRVYAYDYSGTSRIPEVNRAGPHQLAPFDIGPAPRWLVVAALRTYPFPTLFGTWGLEGSYDTDLQNFYPAHLALMTRFMRRAEGKAAQTRLLQLGAVERVLALHVQGFEGLPVVARLPSLFRGPVYVFAVPDPVPRTYVATRARPAEGMAAVDAILADDFRAQDDVVLSRAPVIAPPVAPPAASAPPAPAPRGWSRIMSWRPDRIRLEADAPVGGYVVLVDTFDPGWRATVDGEPADILRANVAFRAVALAPGRHTIDLVYRPRSVTWGLALTALTLAALAAGRVVAARGARRRSTRPRPTLEPPATTAAP